MSRAPQGGRGRSTARVSGDGTGRYVFALSVLTLMLAVIAGRLVWIQVLDADEYAEGGMHQRERFQSVTAHRGTIFDREGEVLATTVEAKTVAVEPRKIENKRAVARALSTALGGVEASYTAILESNRSYAVVQREVGIDSVRQLQTIMKRKKLKFITFEDDARRLYPGGTLAANVLGFVSDGGEGLEGIEHSYDATLAGTPGFAITEQSPGKRKIPGALDKEKAPRDGKDITLTIDRDIQARAESQLAAAVKRYKAAGGSITVIDPRNGEILAMASNPTFDPGDFGEAKPGATRSRAIVDVYEPGSTFKCLTAAAVIDAGIANPNTMLTLPPTTRVGGRTIHEAHGRGTVRWSLTDIIVHSSNVGTVKLARRVGADALVDYYRAFGVGSRTGVDFSGEARGSLLPADQWSGASIGNIPFGQGVAMTPLQLSRALAALANGGVLVTPHFVKRCGSKTLPAPAAGARVVTTETATAMTAILEQVVERGTGTSAAIPGYRVAGKTGTAQKPVPGRGYVSGHFIGSFIGYLPADNPRVLICVVIDEPKAGYYGGTVAAPAFADIGRFAAEHLGIAPSKDASSGAGVKKVSGSSVKD